VLRTSGRWWIGFDRCLPWPRGCSSRGPAAVVLPRAGRGRPTGCPRLARLTGCPRLTRCPRCSRCPGFSGCSVARLFDRALGFPDGIVESSNLPTSGSHGETVPNLGRTDASTMGAPRSEQSCRLHLLSVGARTATGYCALALASRALAAPASGPFQLRFWAGRR
jgi:hypothetical protein